MSCNVEKIVPDSDMPKDKQAEQIFNGIARQYDSLNHTLSYRD